MNPAPAPLPHPEPRRAHNVASLVAEQALVHPHATALRFEGRRWSYAELDADAARAASVLRALGVAPGDRVVVHLPNHPAFVIAYLGALRVGAIVASVSTAWTAPDAARAIADAEPALVLLTEAQRDRLAACGAAPDAARHVTVADGAGADAPVDSEWERLLARARPDAAMHSVLPDDPAAILYTSGTGGAPRGVVLSHANVRGNAIAKARYTGLGPHDGTALVVPLFHCYGQNAVMNATFAAGGCVVLQRRFDPDALVRDAGAGIVTALFAVPPVLRQLLDRDDPSARSALAALRYVFSAATTLPPTLAEEWSERVGHTVHEGYGLTESSPFAAYNHRRRHVPGALGTPIRGVTMAIGDPESGALLEAGEPGEILIRGPNVMLGYWRRAEETAHALRDGWLHTGDLGVRDDGGYYHLRDRMHDLVKVSGFRVHPSTVEDALRRHPAVRDAAAVGVPDPVLGERVEAVVVTAESWRGSARELLEHCRPLLAAYEVPSALHLRPALPISATGKVLRRVLRDELRHAADPPPLLRDQ